MSNAVEERPVGFAEREGFSSYVGFDPISEVTLVVYAEPEDGNLRNNDLSYNTCWGAAAANYINNAVGSNRVGQVRVAPHDGQKYIFRAYLPFAAHSYLPPSATLLSAVLSLVGSSIAVTGEGRNFRTAVVDGSDVADSGLVLADYGDLRLSVTDLASSVWAEPTALGPNWQLNADNEFTLNALGLAAVSKTNLTKLALRSAWDITQSGIPFDPGEEFVYYYSSRTTTPAYRPKLTIVYQL